MAKLQLNNDNEDFMEIVKNCAGVSFAGKLLLIIVLDVC